MSAPSPSVALRENATALLQGLDLMRTQIEELNGEMASMAARHRDEITTLRLKAASAAVDPAFSMPVPLMLAAAGGSVERPHERDHARRRRTGWAATGNRRTRGHGGTIRVTILLPLYRIMSTVGAPAINWYLERRLARGQRGGVRRARDRADAARPARQL